MASIKIEDPNKHILLSLAFTASTHVFRSRVYGLQKPKHIQKKKQATSLQIYNSILLFKVTKNTGLEYILISYQSDFSTSLISDLTLSSQDQDWARPVAVPLASSPRPI